MPKQDTVTLTDIHFKPYYKHWDKLKEDFPSGFVYKQCNKMKKATVKKIKFSHLLSEVQMQKLKLLTKNKDNSLYVIVLAALAILMHKYSREEEIIIDSPLHKALENQFASTGNVPMCLKFDINENIKSAILRVKQLVQDSYRYQNYPRELVSESINFTNFSTNILFSFESIHRELDLRYYDLVFHLSDSTNGFRLDIYYNNQYFENHFVNQIPHHFNRIIDQLDSEHLTIAELYILSKAEIHKILNRFNENSGNSVIKSTIVELFEKQVEKHPDLIALLVNNKSYSYAELNKNANRLAHYLRNEYNVKRGDFVGLILDKSEFIIIGILGILKAGCAYVPIDPKSPSERINFIIEDTRLKVLLTQIDYFYDLQGFVKQLFIMDIQLYNLSPIPAMNLNDINDALDPAYMIYTSGSTGKPKGVLINHMGVVNLSCWQKSQFNVEPGKYILQFFSYSFDGAVGETFMALLNGATLAMYNSDHLNIQDLTDFLNQNRISVGVFVPSLLKQLDPLLLTNNQLRWIVSVGEKCPMDLVERWMKYCRFVNAYGPTEYTVYSHLAEIRRLYDNNSVPIGAPIHNTKSYILDSTFNPLPIGVVGEIYISGAGIAKGYWKSKELTLEKFIPNPFFLRPKFNDNGFVKIESAQLEIDEFKRNRKHNIASIANFENKYTTIEALSQLLNGLDTDLENISQEYLNECKEQQEKFSSFRRYFLEGYYGTYASSGINIEVIQKLIPIKNFKGSNGVDLGFGNGEVMQYVADLGANVLGVELSPFAVQKARNRGFQAKMGKVDMDLEDFLNHFDLNQESMDFVISILLLDRVQKPLNLLKNMFSLLKKEGNFVLQTLLPVSPLDDGDVENKIVYTPNESRITSGENIDIDKLRIIQLLYEMGAKELTICKLPIAVSSRDGIQDYMVYSFQGVKDTTPKLQESIYSRMYKTGDNACYLSDGNIDFKGRVDNQVKLRGFRIELEEIEKNILTHQSVDEAVVVVNDEHPDKQTLLAYYIANSPITKDELKSYLDKKLPGYMVPSDFMELTNMPLNVSGKIDKQSLPTFCPENHRIDPPKNEIERVLLKIWREVLDKEDIGVHTNFFEIGGHSLKATQLCYNINKNLNVMLDLSQIFENPTISSQAILTSSSKVTNFEPIPKVSESDLYAVSYAQQRIWLAIQMGADPSLFNIPMAHKFFGELNIEALEMAFLKMIDRHEILRTIFVAKQQTLFQVVEPMTNQRFVLKVNDVSNIKNKQEQIAVLLKNMMAPFDIQKGPLFRCSIVKLARNEYSFFLNFHHIICDGWSMDIFVNEMLMFYQSITENKDITLPSLRIQYKDFAFWHNNNINKGKFVDCKNYWMSKLSNLYPQHLLLTDYPRSRDKNYAGKSYFFEFSDDFTVKLFDFIGKKQSSLFNVMVGFVKILLFKYTGQANIIVGTPVAGRNHADLENQIGIFLNLLPLSTSFDKEMSISHAINSVKKTLFEAYKYQDYPFDLMLADLEVESNLNTSPIFNTLVQVLDNGIKNSEISLPGIEMKNYEFPTTLSKYDLSFFFHNFTNKIKIEIEYSSELFKESTIEKYCKDLEKIVFAAIKDQGLKIREIELTEDKASQEENEDFLRSMLNI